MPDLDVPLGSWTAAGACMDRRDILVALEVTASGPDPARDAPLAVAAARYVDGALEASMARDVSPVDLPRGAAGPVAAGTARSEEDWELVLEELAAFIGRDQVLAHDVDRQLRLLRLYGLTARPGPDTRRMARILLPEAVDMSLEALLAELGATVDGTEALATALDRARATHALYEALQARARGLPAASRAALADLAARVGWPEARAFGAPRRPAGRGARQAAFSIEASGPSPGSSQAPSRGPLQPTQVPLAVDAARLEAILAPGGALQERIGGFEDRPAQREMLLRVADALNRGDQLLVEAGTGIGKSLAYLLPAAAWARLNGRTVVVATHTIHLQDQLWGHDLPLVASLLDTQLSTCLLKGRANYLCRTRLEHQLGRRDLEPSAAPVLGRLLVWSDQTRTGDRAELGLEGPDEGVWRTVAADAEGCAAEGCRYAGAGLCHVTRARARAEAAHVVIVNHALLISDMAVDHRLLPRHMALIVDEAHHLEDVATQALGFTVSRREVREVLADLSSDAGHGCLDVLATAATGAFEPVWGEPVRTRARALGAEVREAALATEALFAALADFLETYASGATAEVRIGSAARAQPDWLLVETAWEPFDRSVQVLRRSLAQLVHLLVTTQSDVPDCAAVIGELLSASRSLGDDAAALLRGLVRPTADDIVWARRDRSRAPALCLAPLSVADTLAMRLFADKETVILTSATLQTDGGFEYLRSRIGLPDAPGLAVGSPFDYRRSALVLLPNDMPGPDEPGYQDALDRTVGALAADLGGRTLVLYTSHSGLQATYHRVRAPLGTLGIAVRGQGMDGDRSRLISDFRREDARTLLLGTRSFWEGIDVPGEALSCLVVARLPFDVPTDPVFEARAETYEDPFREFMLPRAILRFRQGFGRLIRGASDRGVFVLLDARARQRGYGHAFLDALPACRRRVVSIEALPSEARRFLQQEPDGDSLQQAPTPG